MAKVRHSSGLLVYLSGLFFLLLPGLAYCEDILQKGISEYRAENFEEALETLSAAKAQLRDSSVASFYLGLAYKQTGRFRDAATNFRDAIRLVPSIKDAYAELAEVLYYLDELGEAGEVIAEAEQAGANPAGIAFLKGLILAKEGKTTEAVQAFRRAKDIDPSLSQSADFQAALALARGKRMEEAGESLRAVISIDPASEIASYAREYEEAISGIGKRRRWNFSAGLGYLYDDNVISKPSGAIGLPLVDQATGKEDSGTVTTFSASYNPQPEGPWSLSGQYNLYSTTYFHTFSHDLLSHSLSLIPGYGFSGGAAAVPLTLSHVLQNERPYQFSISAKPTLNMIFLSRHIAQLSVGYGRRDFLDYFEGFDPAEDRDATIYSGLVGYLYPFAGGDGLFNARYEHIMEFAEGNNWANRTNRMSLGLLYPANESVDLSLSGEVMFQRFDNIHTLTVLSSPVAGYPAAPTKRKDDVYSVSAGVTWEFSKGWNINVQYSYTRDDSNFAIYDYSRNTYLAGMEYRF